MKKKTALTGLMYTDLDIQVSYISNNNAKLWDLEMRPKILSVLEEEIW